MLTVGAVAYLLPEFWTERCADVCGVSYGCSDQRLPQQHSDGTGEYHTTTCAPYDLGAQLAWNVDATQTPHTTSRAALVPGALMRILELQAVRDCAAARVALQQ